MKTRDIIGIIILCIATSLYIRIVLPYDHIFTGEWIKFSSIDAYWQMAQVDKFAPDFPAHITQIFEIPFFIWILSGITWCIGLGTLTQHTIDTVGVYFPAILGALTIVPVYFIGKVMFGRMVGIVAAILIVILPGEWLGRSVLGFTDHHVMEVLLSTTAMMFFVIAFNSKGKKRIVSTVLSALFLGMYSLTFLGSILFFAIIGAFLCVQVTIDALQHRAISYHVTLLVSGAILSMIVLVVDPNYISQMAKYAVAISGETGITTIEMRPFLYPSGTFTFALAWATFGFITLLVPVALAILTYQAVKTGHSSVVLLIIWSIATMVLMLEYRRFAYYFVVNATLLTGWFTWYFWCRMQNVLVNPYSRKKAKKHQPWLSRERSMIFAVLTTAILLFILISPNVKGALDQAKQALYVPPDAWYSTLEWVEENTPENSLVLAWWDYGYWIRRIANRNIYVNPSQHKGAITNTANMFLGGKIIEADYLILDYDITTGKMWAVATWAGKQPADFSNIYYISESGQYTPVHLFHPEYYQSLIVRLYNFDGEVIIPNQSTVINFNPSNGILQNVDIYATYEEALAHVGLGDRLVGTSPFISPIPLEAVGGYTLVYESEQKVNGISAVKVFKRIRH